MRMTAAMWAVSRRWYTRRAPADRGTVSGWFWWVVAWALLGRDFWTAGGYIIGGDQAATSPAFDLLREVPGGMRTYGLFLAGFVLAASWALGRGGRAVPIVFGLLLTAYHATFVLGTPAAWIMHRFQEGHWDISSIGAPFTYAVFMVIYGALALSTPRRLALRQGGDLHGGE